MYQFSARKNQDFELCRKYKLSSSRARARRFSNLDSMCESGIKASTNQSISLKEKVT